jgi:hypothetical protein
MTTAEIISSAIAGLSLIVSVLTAYLTLLSRFKGTVLPKRRVVLTQVEGAPCLALECEFVNDGSKPGSIDDILVKMRHLETGLQLVLVPFLVRDQFNIFQRYQMSDFTTFSGISLGARQRRELFVIFKPIQAKFEPPNGKVVLHTSICANTGSKYVESPTLISLNLEEDVVKRWASPDGSPQLIQAIEVSQSRREYLERQR